MTALKVRFGDTLSQIAQRVGSTVQQLARANGIANPHDIKAGSTLKIPGRVDEYVAPRKTEGMPVLDGGQTGGVTSPGGASAGGALEVARSLIGRAYGDPSGASGAAVGRDSPFMHCAQFVNAVYPNLPPGAPRLAAMATPGNDPKPGDVVTSTQPAPWGHVGIYTERGTIIHSIPGRGVHESSRAEFEAYSPISGTITP